KSRVVAHPALSITLRGADRLCGFCSFRLGSNASLVGCALRVNVPLDELDDGHRSIVALAVASLHDTQVAAVAGCVARSDGVEQLLDGVLVLDLRDRLTTSVQVAALAECDKLLDDRADFL